MSSSETLSPIILIPARLASTRLPEKVLADIGGEPMIVRVWKRAVASGIPDVVVACDDARVKAVVEQAGGKAVMTHADHASGSDRIFEALEVIDPEKKFNVVINMQGDMPTFEPALIHSVLKPLLHHAHTDIATLAAEISDEREKTDPAVVKVVIAEDGRALYFSRATIPTGEGPLYHHIGIYAYRREALEKFVHRHPSPLEKREKLEQLRALEHGMRIEVDIVDTVPLGVDTQETLEKARKLCR